MLARSDVVGSLLRPPGLTPETLDAAVDEVLRRQEEAGLEVVTDGELRRLSFQSQMVEAVDGFGDWNLDAFLWGDWRSDDVGALRGERPPLAVTGKLLRRRWLFAA